jgi:hypothetical protein
MVLSINIRLKSILLVVGLLVLPVYGVHAQDSIPKTSFQKNTFFVEALGNGGLYSFNYDRLILNKKKFSIAIRLGASYLPGYDGAPNYNYSPAPLTFRTSKWLAFPFECTFLFGKKHFLEMGFGTTYLFGSMPYLNKISTYRSELFLTTRLLGYRYQKPNGGFFLTQGFCV